MRHRLRIIISLTALLIFSGCVYYNTFFLAKQKFDQAEKRQQENQRAKENQQNAQNPARNLPGNQGVGNQLQGPGSLTVPSDVKALYDDAIKKATKVLTYHPDSKWADDALWLIGKSYFTMGDYIMADSRFKELVTNHPNSKFVDRCNFYMGLCQMNLGHEDLALSAFDAVEHAPRKSPYLEYVLFAKGAMELNGENYGDAEEFFKQYIGKYPGGDSAAMAQYYIGLCRERRKDYWDAHTEYDIVQKFHPSKNLYFDATLASATMALESDSVNLGMKILEELGANQEYFSKAADIRLKTAEGYHLMKDLDKAIDLYKQITTQNPRTQESAEAYYRLGLIYQNDLFDLPSAKEAFNKAQSESPSSQFRPLAMARLAQITKLETYQSQLGRADSLKRIDELNSMGTPDLPPAGTSLSSDTPASQIIPKFIGPPVDSLPTGSTDSLTKSVIQEWKFIGPPLEDMHPAGESSGYSRIDSLKSPKTDRAGFVGPRLEDLSSVAKPNPFSQADSLKNSRPITPGFIGPRLEDILAQNDSMRTARSDSLGLSHPARPLPDSLAGQRAQSTGNNGKTSDSISQVNEDSIRQAIWLEAMETRYMLGELYAYELNRPDSALQEYLLIVREHPESPYAPRALLAAAQIEMNLGDSAAARGYLQQLLRDFSKSPQAVRAAEILNQPLDMTTNAMGLYADAESLVYVADKPDSAIALYKYIARNFPDLAPQASYAVAWVLDQIIGVEDSSAYYAYSEVAQKYPDTPFGKAASDRLTGTVENANKPKLTTPQEEPAPEQAPEQENPDSTALLAGGLPLAPEVTQLGEFVYPEALFSRDLKGKVIFKIKLDISGRVRSEEIIGPSGEYAIDSSATAALMNTQFDVSKLDLIQLDGYFQYSITFRRPNVNIYDNPYLIRQETGGG
jgi:TonB family protein